jgi:hypothetical protein
MLILALSKFKAWIVDPEGEFPFPFFDPARLQERTKLRLKNSVMRD